ncbi:hypothetical protein L204_101067 [Cryptococcus depauperatus]|nr:hemolysin [Cryptococcus depauperatus CBS 7855]
MPPLLKRTAKASLPTLISLSKLIHLIPRFNQQWSLEAAPATGPIEPEDPPDSPKFWYKLGLSIVLVLAGGVFAGLTLALMGSDDLNLRVLSTSSPDLRERKSANKVLRLLAKGRHWVLVVLLLGNVIVNESLPIFLDDVLGGGLYAVIASTTMIVIFGEIIPQAVCVRYGLAIGGVCAPLVWAFMILFSPIAWPIAKLLDYILGKDEGHTYKKAELKSFLQFHREGEEPLRDDEIAILNGVLSLNDKHAKEIMTPIKDCLILSADRILDHATIDQILLSGFSRIPVYEAGQSDNFVGMLLVKKLISYNPDDAWPVSKFSLLPLPEAKPNINCFQVLDYFQTGRAHLLLISETPGQRGGALGIVSLEDLIEEIIGEEIVDETDIFEDNHSKKAVKRSGPAAVMRGIIERRRVLNAFSRQPSRSDTPTPVVPTNPSLSSATDGILVQINDGNVVAEPVGLSENGQTTPVNSTQKLVSTRKAYSGITASIKERTDLEEVSDKTVTNEDHSSRNDLDELGTSATDQNLHRTNGCGKPEELVEAFPAHTDFEKACRAMIAKYEDINIETIGPSLTNRGWQWKEHKFVPHQGYLYRRIIRHVSPLLASQLLDAGELSTSAVAESEEEGLEEDDDSALLSYSKRDQEQKKLRVEVEQHIVFSQTYRVPMFCFRAWDETGAPVSVAVLLKLRILHPDMPTQPLRFGEYGEALDTLMLSPEQIPCTEESENETSCFPLVQSAEHPTTGDLVLTIHPCKISGAVEEVLRSEGLEKDDQKGLRWLEAWMMMSGRVADLTYP